MESFSQKWSSHIPSYQYIEPRSIEEQRKCGNKSIHFCAGEATIETIFRALLYANQLTITEQSQIYVKDFLKHWLVRTKQMLLRNNQS